MVSRILGVVRECVYSYFFSTTELLSAFRIAFMAPNLARRLFGEGALSAALIPVLTESVQSQGEASSRRFVGTLLTYLGVVLVGLVVLVELVIAGWRAICDDPALELTAILIPYMILICGVAVAGGVLNVRRHFATPAAAPIILNLGIIGGTLGGALWADLRGMELMYVLCGSVLVAGVIQLAVTGVALRAVSFFPIFSGRWRDPQVRMVLRLMAPMILGLAAVQINTLADYLIAYFFVTEDGVRVGPAVLGYAQYLYQLPLGVFGISLATAIFPVLSEKAARNDGAGLAETVGRGLRLGLFIALPAAVGLIFVAGPLVATLYQRGEFDAGDTRRVAGVLVFYSLGLPAYFVQHVVVRTYYAMKNSRTPARVAMYMVGVNFVLNLVLVFPLEERGLALATAACAVVQVIWLGAGLRRLVPELAWRKVAAGVVKSVVATVIMVVVLLIVSSPSLVGGLARTGPVVRLTTLVVLGVVAYMVAARLLRIEELGVALRGRKKGSG